jgi:putative endonuclease
VDPKALGRLGERAALQHLEARGWTILGQNVRVGRRELDLIIRKGRVLAFVEVKTRGGSTFGTPLEAITPLKQREVCRAAAGWISERALPPETLLRFDAVGVVRRRNGDLLVTHVPDAWQRE